MPGACEFYQDGDTPAFAYYRRASNGSRVEVGYEASPQGLCYFPDATCEDSNFSCCQMTEEMHGAAKHGESINLSACIIALVLPTFIYSCVMQIIRRRRAAAESEEEEESEEEKEETEEDVVEVTARILSGRAVDEAEEEPGQPETPGWRRRLKIMLVCVAFGLSMWAEIYYQTLAANVTQRYLSVPARNSMLAGDAFLTPLREIFQFLEDVVTVKIMAAIGAQTTRAVRPILFMGTAGGFVCGVVAALLATGLCFWPPALRWLLAPYAAHDDSLGCELVPKGDEAAQLARTYLLLQAWCWPASFVGMAVRGFLLGSLELTSFVVMGLAQAVIQIVLLKALFVPNPSLTNLGWISFVGSYTSVIFTLGIFVFRSELRARYDLTCRRRKASDEDDDDGAQVSWKAASQEGLAAMLLDVSAQMSITGGVYTAGAMLGMGAMYQISALQAAFMQYGLQWVYALTYSLRLQGTQMVAAGQYHQFNALFRFVVIYGLILVVTAAATMVPFRAPLAFLQAEQACEYASHKSCVNIFTDVFGGGTSLQGTLQGSTMLFFVPVLAARCFYQLFKAGLYACLDWNFMARIGVVSFAAVFVPAIVVSVFVRTVASIVVAMYLPLLAMAVAFIFRTRRNIKYMLNDQPGPWQQ